MLAVPACTMERAKERERERKREREQTDNTERHDRHTDRHHRQNSDKNPQTQTQTDKETDRISLISFGIANRNCCPDSVTGNVRWQCHRTLPNQNRELSILSLA